MSELNNQDPKRRKQAMKSPSVAKFFLGVATLLTLSAVSFSDAMAQAGGGPPGGGPPGGMGMGRGMMAMRAFDIDAIWSDLAFKVNTDDKQIGQIRGMLLSLWKKREEVLAQARQNRDMEGAQGQLAALKKQCDEKLKLILTKEQLQAYTRLSEERQKRFEEMGRMMGAPQ
jgi:hypothetical protein